MLKIITVVVTPFQQNARLIFDPNDGQAVLVDPGGEVERILAHIPSDVKTVSRILLTHAHIDHGGGVQAALVACEERFSEKPKVVAYPEDYGFRASISEQARLYGFSPNEYENVPEPDSFLEDDSTLLIGSFSGRALFTPGHAPDHLSLYFEETPFRIETFEAGQSRAEVVEGTSPLLLAGDTLFSGSIGRTDLPGGDTALLLSSIKEKIFSLPDETRVMPGHGPDTSVGVEKRSNPFMRGA